MANVQHTPGPWTAYLYDSEPASIEAADGDGPIALVGTDLYDMEERDANARLMAAAPDLLAACEGLLAIARISAADGADLNINIRRAEAAIAEATGQTA